ncbi:energy transducer TonB [Flavobacterium rhizosphaerae]|uniref:Energy transducer TonB n=1 Tax=Flavobacterium rhizosphaerae TaxID=3163298 RepID=A0ABW8Z033_9FLAO
MSKANVFNQEWIDLVFEGRNQTYGAYQLRRDDNKTTLLALISGILLLGVLIAIPAISSRFANNNNVPGNSNTPPIINDSIVVHVLEQPEKPKTPETPPENTEPVQSAAPRPTQPTTALKPLSPTSSPVDDVPTMEDFENTNPGPVTDPGTGLDGIDLGDPIGTAPSGHGTSAAGIPEGSENLGTVDIKPEFPGGLQNFYSEVSRKFRVPDASNAMTLKVYVSFIVEKDGSMSNIKVGRDPGYGIAQEAIRVLKSIKTKWEPGVKNGIKVRTSYSLPITVQVH